MPVTLELILFILIAISAVGYLIKESQKTKKRTLGISLELLVLFWSIWRISTIIIQISEYNLSWIKFNIPSIMYMTSDFLLVPPWRTEQLANLASCFVV